MKNIRKILSECLQVIDQRKFDLAEEIKNCGDLEQEKDGKGQMKYLSDLETDIREAIG